MSLADEMPRPALKRILRHSWGNFSRALGVDRVRGGLFAGAVLIAGALWRAAIDGWHTVTLTTRTLQIPAGLVIVLALMFLHQVRKAPAQLRNMHAAAEAFRREQILHQLRTEMPLALDGLTAEQLAGNAPMPKEWVEARLAEMGETWRRDEYMELGPRPKP